MDNDIKWLENLLPSFNAHLTRYVDLKETLRLLDKHPTYNYPYPENRSTESLSNFAAMILGKVMDGRETNSLWTLCPVLRPEQQIYAALDAYVPLQIIDHLENSFGTAEFKTLIARSSLGQAGIATARVEGSFERSYFTGPTAPG